MRTMFNRRSFIKTGLIFVPGSALAQVALSKRAPFFRPLVAAGGGGGVWFDGEIVANGTTEGANDSSTLYWQLITPNVSGTCTKLRIYQHNTASLNFKMGIWNGDKTLIDANAFGTGATTGSAGYYEVTLGVQPSVTSGVNYQIAWEPDTNTGGWWYQTSSGTFNFNNGGTYTYSSWPGPSAWGSLNLPADNTLTRKYCVSMFIA